MTVGILNYGFPDNIKRITLNAPLGVINLAKGFGFNVDPTNQSANGYPVTTPAAGTFGSNPNMPGGYFGTFTWSWSGQGSMQITASPPIIVTSGSSLFVGGPFADSAGGNISILSQIAPTVVFLWGVNIQSIVDSGISNGIGGTYIKVTTKTGFAANLFGTVNISGITTQINANGTWSITLIDAQSFYLTLNQNTGQVSSWSAGQGV